jgi:hypothetical protein
MDGSRRRRGCPDAHIAVGYLMLACAVNVRCAKLLPICHQDAHRRQLLPPNGKKKKHENFPPTTGHRCLKGFI